MAFKPFNWICPYCDRAQTVTEDRYSLDENDVYNGTSTLGILRLRAKSIVCANQECRQLWLQLSLHKRNRDGYGHTSCGKEIQNWQVLPDSAAKVQPAFITKALVADYSEACRILNLSPKASATLARRCLQGMIRDFAGIKKNTLFQEIESLSTAVTKGNAPLGVTAESVEAIDHVRKIGNIGAHMEKDVNLIIEIEPDEAEQLIGLIELLFKEWYVARHDRERRLDALKATAKAKSVAKKPKTKAAAQKTGGQEGKTSSKGA